MGHIFLDIEYCVFKETKKLVSDTSLQVMQEKASINTSPGQSVPDLAAIGAIKTNFLLFLDFRTYISTKDSFKKRQKK